MTSTRISRVWGVITLLITIFSLSLPAYAKYSGGTGEPNDSYQIATADDLIALGETPKDYDKHFILTADIDLDPNLPGRMVFDKAIIAPTKTAFTGVFDGNGHIISRLTIMGKSGLGLFAVLGFGAEVKDLGVVDVNIIGSDDLVGGLVGINFHGTVTECYSSGTVSGGQVVGGLVGDNEGNVAQCYSAAATNGTSDVGGLIGLNFGTGTVTQCYSMGAVSGDSDVGGLAGVNYGYVTQCYSAAATNGTSDVGGLIGDNNGTVTQCYSSAVTNGTSDVGGLIGHNNVGTVTQCYSMGVVSGDSGVGGLVGGSDEDTIIQCFWDTQTSGQVTSAGGIGLTTAEMQMESTFFAWGACEGAGVWSINEGHDYPRLSWENKTGQSIQSSLSDFLEGHGTQDDPYLIYTVADVNTIAVFPCEQDKCFRLMFLDGAGTQDDPYLICTADQLDLMGTCPYERQAHFKLTADIDLDPNLPGRKIFDKAVISNFFGVFDGNGHKISHLTIVGTDYLGLFGRLGEWRPYEEVDVVGEVKNLGTVDVNINGVGNNIGGLVGENYGTIEQCHSTGEVSGDWSVGGLVGSNEGSITACYSTGTVSGNGSYCDGGIGGLVGTNFRQITNCYSTSTVHGNYYAGGLIGVNDGRGFGQADWGVSFHRFVAECYSSGIVNGAEVVGGLVGANGLEIANCYSTSIVVGNQYVGGLVGQNWSSYPLVTDIEVSGIIVRCYSTGAVSGNSNVGGLVGGNSYFILGQGNQGTVTNCVWDIETSGQQGSADGVGLKTNEMMDSYMPDMNGFANDPNWVLGDGRDYPRLAWESTMEQIIPESEINWLEGQGTTEDPYIIDTADQLIRLGKAIILWDKNLVLGADIDLDPNLPGRQVFTQAPIKVFSGIFDGNGHTISHLNIKGWDGWDYLGLFGQLQRGAELRNLGVIDVNIVGSGSYIGGLVGYNSASIANCYSKGTFTGGYDVGGLLGRNIGSIANSYSIGTISGSYVGGLVGSNGGSVSNCYSSGMVTGYWYVCGLVGVGNLDKVAQSFWDIQTSGLTVSFGGTGKTTAQMQTASTFLDAGWDFVDETENGTEDIWWINEGQDYPRLWWEAE